MNLITQKVLLRFSLSREKHCWNYIVVHRPRFLPAILQLLKRPFVTRFPVIFLRLVWTKRGRINAWLHFFMWNKERSRWWVEFPPLGGKKQDPTNGQTWFFASSNQWLLGRKVEILQTKDFSISRFLLLSPSNKESPHFVPSSTNLPGSALIPNWKQKGNW